MILCLSLGFGLGLLAAVWASHVDTRRALRRTGARRLTVAPFYSSRNSVGWVCAENSGTLTATFGAQDSALT